MTVGKTKQRQTKPRERLSPEDVRIEQAIGDIATYGVNIFLFVADMWGLYPQPCRPEYQERWGEVWRSTGDTWVRLRKTVTADWFGNPTTEPGREEWEWDWHDFRKGTHITWQQTLILLGINKGALNEAPRHLSIGSGHGTGKSAVCAWITLWFLYCFHHSQVPVTAPTAHQMHDVLWKEIKIWIDRLPEQARDVFVWQSEYIRMHYDPETWFARARTSTKENTEAIAGIHADHVAIIADEASGIPMQVFDTAEGALTSGNVFVIMISNCTQPTGYFYDSHHKNKSDWQTFNFNCEQSPVVDREYVLRQLKRHGRDSDNYRIRVLGVFPREGVMDDSGYIQLMPESKIEVIPAVTAPVFVGRRILGIDPSGEGKDKASYCVRDSFKAEIVHEEQTTNPKAIAEKAITLIDRYDIDPSDVVVDSFGVGADVGKEIAIGSDGKYRVYTVLVGNAPQYEEQLNGQFFERLPEEMDDDNKDLYMNIKALMFFRTRKWLIGGGYLLDTEVDNSTFKNEIVVVKYKRSLQGNKIQMMSKKEMLKLRIPSPNKADALSLTQLRTIAKSDNQSKEDKDRIRAEDERIDDRHAVL